MAIKCRDGCKWFGYNYKTDEYGHILKSTGYRCMKFNVDICNSKLKCEDCLKDEVRRRELKNEKNRQN